MSVATPAFVPSRLLLLFFWLYTGIATAQDLRADNMLLYQRSYGGWPKHIDEVKLDYGKKLTEAQKRKITAHKNRIDGTIDNDATVKEIRYLAKAYKQHQNPQYLAAVHKGIRYLLKAQYENGGWPQFYPDSSGYRGQITYNDGAMVNVLNLLQDTALGINDLEVVEAALKPAVTTAVAKGVACILQTQVKVNGKLTVWCAQHNQNTLHPEKARTYELVSLSGSESVGIVEFLMRVEQPSQQLKDAVQAAVAWFEKSRIEGYTFASVAAPSQPNGRDRVLQPSPGHVLWARFYDIQTNEPMFAGRDGIKRKDLREVEHERRTGYAWYGTWPADLLTVKYPKWAAKHL